MAGVQDLIDPVLNPMALASGSSCLPGQQLTSSPTGCAVSVGCTVLVGLLCRLHCAELHYSGPYCAG